MFRCIVFNLSHPFDYVFEGLFVVNGITNTDTISSFKEALSESVKTLLTSGVPELVPNTFSVDIFVFEFEINGYSGEVGEGEFVIGVSSDETGFSYS